MDFERERHAEIEETIREMFEDEKLLTAALILNDIARNVACIAFMNPEQDEAADMSVKMISTIITMLAAVDSGATLEELRELEPPLPTPYGPDVYAEN